jgi:hypothetical protein
MISSLAKGKNPNWQSKNQNWLPPKASFASLNFGLSSWILIFDI